MRKYTAKIIPNDTSIVPFYYEFEARDVDDANVRLNLYCSVNKCKFTRLQSKTFRHMMHTPVMANRGRVESAFRHLYGGDAPVLKMSNLDSIDVTSVNAACRYLRQIKKPFVGETNLIHCTKLCMLLSQVHPVSFLKSLLGTLALSILAETKKTLPKHSTLTVQSPPAVRAVQDVNMSFCLKTEKSPMNFVPIMGNSCALAA